MQIGNLACGAWKMNLFYYFLFFLVFGFGLAIVGHSVFDYFNVEDTGVDYEKFCLAKGYENYAPARAGFLFLSFRQNGIPCIDENYYCEGEKCILESDKLFMVPYFEYKKWRTFGD